jgi:hypothetical protein
VHEARGKVFEESATLDECLEWNVRRRDESNIQADRSICSDWPDFPMLDRVQQLSLHCA